MTQEGGGVDTPGGGGGFGGKGGGQAAQGKREDEECFCGGGDATLDRRVEPSFFVRTSRAGEQRKTLGGGWKGKGCERRERARSSLKSRQGREGDSASALQILGGVPQSGKGGV